MTEHADPAIEKHRDRWHVGQRRGAHDRRAKAKRRGAIEQIVHRSKGMDGLVAGEDEARPFDNRIDGCDEFQGGMVNQRVGVSPTGRSDAEDGHRNRCVRRAVMSHMRFFGAASSTLKEDSAAGPTRR